MLTSLPLVSLLLYLLMATDLFEKDKMAYVYDSSTSNAKSLSAQIRLELSAFLDRVKPIVEGYNYSKGIFSSSSIVLFKKQERLDAIVLFQMQNGRYQKLGILTEDNMAAKKFSADNKLISDIMYNTQRDSVFISVFENSEMHLAIGQMIGKKTDANHLILVSLYRASDLYKSFNQTSLYSSFLINKKGSVRLGESNFENLDVKPIDRSNLFQPIFNSKLPEGTNELEIDSKNYIVSYADTGLGNIYVASIINKENALKAVEVLVAKSVLFFIALISSTVIISVFASIKLTSTLRDLYDATKKISEGKFDINVKSRSRDEVGGLAEGFNLMAAEVSRLMKETAEKARMQGELETVKTVQDSFFPPVRSRFGPLDIMGHFEPASECGGDWWYYSKVGDMIYLWIGDATGHGTPAALVTSAAKSASAIIEQMPDMTPGRALQIMNRAIHGTSKGKIMMTFFLAAIDTKTGKMVYANASHEPPYLMSPNKEKKLSKKDLIPLMDVNGPRLGDQSDAVYEEAEVQLKKGDTILFYTDGIVDLQNPEGEVWGERKFIKAILDSMASGDKINEKVQHMKDTISTYRKDTVLVDDVTLFMCKYDEEAAA